MKDEKWLGNVTQPSPGVDVGIGGTGMVPLKKLFPKSIIIKEYQRTKEISGQHRKINEIIALIYSPRARVCS